MKWFNTLLLILIAVLLYLRWFGHGGISELQEKELQLEVKQEEIERLQERNKKLSAEVADLKQGLDAIEERARSELGMIKEDETFIQVINPTEENDEQ